MASMKGHTTEVKSWNEWLLGHTTGHKVSEGDYRDLERRLLGKIVVLFPKCIFFFINYVKNKINLI